MPIVSSSDSAVGTEIAVVSITSSDSAKAVDLQSTAGVIQLYDVDYATGDDEGYAAIAQNPLEQIGFINLQVSPMWSITLDISAHT